MMKKSKRNLLTALLGLVALAVVAPVANAQNEPINYFNTADLKSGKILGYITYKKNTRTWYEQGVGDRKIDAGKNFVQIGGNALDMYLWDQSRGVLLQVDFRGSVVRYGTASKRPSDPSKVPMRDLYKITNVQRDYSGRFKPDTSG